MTATLSLTKPLSILAFAAVLGAPAFAQTAATPAAPAEAPAATAPAAAAPAPAADAAAAPAPAADPAATGDISGTYTFDPSHSQIMFSYNHLGLSTSRSFINGVTGQVTLDKANPAASTVEASFPLSAITMIDPKLNEHLMGDKFFNGASPETLVTFKSTSVEADGDDEAKVTGDLTLNGVTKPITLDVDLKKAGTHPMTGKPVVGFDIEGKIKRSDFGLGALAPAVSDEVDLDISVEASKG